MDYPIKVLEKDFDTTLTAFRSFKADTLHPAKKKRVYKMLRQLNNAIIKLGGEDRSSDLIELTL